MIVLGLLSRQNFQLLMILFRNRVYKILYEILMHLSFLLSPATEKFTWRRVVHPVRSTKSCQKKNLPVKKTHSEIPTDDTKINTSTSTRTFRIRIESKTTPRITTSPYITRHEQTSDCTRDCSSSSSCASRISHF